MLSIVPVILTERKVLWMLVLASPFMALALRRLLPAESRQASQGSPRRAAVGIVASALSCCLCCGLRLISIFLSLTNLLAEAFNLSSGTSEDVIVRKAQYIAMMGEWANTPFLGTGLGGVASYIRSSEQPWAYELSYVALLYHTGFIGLLIYSAGVIWTLFPKPACHSYGQQARDIYGAGARRHDLFSDRQRHKPLPGEVRLPLGSVPSDRHRQSLAAAATGSAHGGRRSCRSMMCQRPVTFVRYDRRQLEPGDQSPPVPRKRGCFRNGVALRGS